MLTKVINKAGKPLLLKEGTAGIQRLLFELDKEKSYNIKVDANATYREYWCVEKNNEPNAVVLSSDDCQEYKEVTIRVKEENNLETYYWEGVRRDNGLKFEVHDGAKKEIPDSPEDTPKGTWKRITGPIISFFKQGDSVN